MSAPVAIAVVSWNTRELLGPCLDSIKPEADAGRVEAWVVDNDSSDGSAELVRESYGWVNLVEPGENLGFGPAVNLVAERTQSEWIAPANADIELIPGSIERLLEAASGDLGAGAFAPRLVGTTGIAQHSVYRFPTVPFTLLFNLGVYRLNPRIGDRLCLEGMWDPSRARRVDWALGAFQIVRRRAWDEAGGFDPGQWMYAEDVDLGWRLDRAGWATRYVPEARVRHVGAAATDKAWGTDKTERWMRSTYAWMRARRGAAITRHRRRDQRRRGRHPLGRASPGCGGAPGTVRRGGEHEGALGAAAHDRSARPGRCGAGAVNKPLPPPEVPADVYDERYYLEACAGYEEWRESGGEGEAGVYPGTLAKAGLRPGERLVDLGTGRGELLASAVEGRGGERGRDRVLTGRRPHGAAHARGPRGWRSGRGRSG